MEAMQAILTRRSIRQYTEAPISEAIVKDLLKCAMAAPSAGNEQSWEFVVIRDKRIFEQIMAVHPFSQMLKQASTAILVCGDIQKEKFAGYWVNDCAAATENILIAAHAQGLGAVWLGVYPSQDRVDSLCEIFAAPEHVMPFALISLGYPAQELPPADRFAESRIHYDRW